MATWFECKVKYDKLSENGQQKTVTEPYLVDALSFTEAEARITEEITPFISGEDENGDRWYKVKVNFITIDEKTAVEKKTANYIMVQAADFKTAYDNFVAGMKGTMADYEIASITETMIVDVYKENLSGKDE